MTPYDVGGASRRGFRPEFRGATHDVSSSSWVAVVFRTHAQVFFVSIYGWPREKLRVPLVRSVVINHLLATRSGRQASFLARTTLRETSPFHFWKFHNSLSSLRCPLVGALFRRVTSPAHSSCVFRRL